ncbi:acyl carrier protein [Streptomyces decoyicus]|uniref:acyl carrier protein n=1 Tax=Streptomyces decoyicus TaxID=249567 RepID=UPI0033ACFC26
MATTASHLIEILSHKFDLGDHITPTTPFTDLDLDSLVLVELAVILSRTYGVPVDESELAEAGTVDEVVALLATKRTAAA